MAKILVADDETDLEVLIKQKFRQKIREKEYEFIFAVNGRDALEKLQQHPDVDIVITDINMPEMDGLTLLHRLNETSPLIKSVIVSAYGDMANIRAAMNRGAFDFLTKPINFEDFAVTVERTILHVAQIQQTLKALKENNILKMYVDENVLNFMGSREFENALTLNENIEATVVVMDICSFTSISENEPADMVVKLLNNYFEIMVDEIVAQGGHVDKFIGDAIMAVFRGNFHLDRAIDACLAVREKIASLPAVNEHVSFKPNVSIGVNSGEMISGNIGSASLRRLDFTVIGDAVNTAQRLQSAAKQGQIIIAQSAFDKVKESFNCKMVGKVSLKNKATPLVLYEVVD
ncbi:MAG: response regulator [Saprospiraceae bacterium]|nr:response regulator [Saprospiraceae bacterium]